MSTQIVQLQQYENINQATKSRKLAKFIRAFWPDQNSQSEEASLYSLSKVN